MSARPYENYLADVFVDWASKKTQPGIRYQFRSPDESNAEKLHQAFLQESPGSIYLEGTELPYIACGAFKLLPVLHGGGTNGFSENYISHLRDCVAGRDANFSDCALLIIHNSKLDTITNSAEDVAVEGRAWDPSALMARLATLIDSASPSRNLLRRLLADQLENVVTEGATVFGFSPLYEAIGDGTVHLSKLGLFDDPFILSMKDNPGQIRRRLEENRELRRRLEFTVENYPDQLEDMFRDEFGTKFIKKNFVDSQGWRDLPYSAFEIETKSNQAQSLALESISCPIGQLIERAKSATKAGRKDLSVLTEIPHDKNEAQLDITFISADIEASQIEISHCPIAKDKVSITAGRAGGKRSRVQIRIPFDGAPLFFTITLRREIRAEQHQFRCLFLRQGDFLVDAFRNHFRIDPNHARITLQMESNNLVLNNGNGDVFPSEDIQDEVDSALYSSVDFSRQTNSSEKIGFNIISHSHRLTFNIEGAPAEESATVPLMFDRDRYDKLFKNDEYRAQYSAIKNRLIVDNRECAVVGVRQMLLSQESAMVDDKKLYENGLTNIYLEDLETIAPALFSAYGAWFSFLSTHGTTPSLVSWGPEFRRLTAGVTAAYENALNAIPRDKVLTENQKKLLRLGTVHRENTEYITPFHPLNLSYQLHLAEEIIKDREAGHDSFPTLPDVTRERLSASGLVPFVYDGVNTVSHVSPMRENPFWLELIPQKDSSFSYVRSLVRDKLSEFTNAYSRLFSVGSRSTMILNVINMGQARELFLGLTDYFKLQDQKACAIHVNCYDDDIVFNEFDRFSECVSTSELRDTFHLGRGGVHDSADLMIDLIRGRLTYSKFRTRSDEPLQYAHLAFFRNNAPVDVRSVRIEGALSGVLCDGLIAGESAENVENAYFSCFGLRDVDFEPFQPLRLARLVGTLLQPARESSSLYVGTGVGLAASTEFRDLLTRSYDSALWTTIIDPKVTLDFFTSQRDVVLIHYSDQYTSSAGYDAITVTKQVDLFKRLLGKERLLSEFNAFNGEWLLKMLTAGETIRKERRGIIGAYKFVRSMLMDSGISWIPLSVAEMIRVSGNVGLKMSESDFSRNLQGYQKGAISDDVLFIGFKNNNVFLLPLEVKTGARPNYTKAIEQTRELKRYLRDDILGPTTLAGKLYRGLFVRQVLMQVEKYRLYGVMDQGALDQLLPRREWWLKGDYLIGELAEYPAGFVLSHLDSDTCFSPSYQLEDDVLKIDLPIGLLETLIDADSAEQVRKIRVDCHVPEQYLLATTLHEHPPAKEVTVDSTPLPHVGRAPGESSPLLAEKSMGASTVVPVINTEPLRILFGHNAVTQKPLFWEPTNTSLFMNSNSGIIGTMGTGKTQFTKSLVTQLIRGQHLNVNSSPIGVLIFDYKSDYVDEAFLKATEASRHQLSRLPYNPLSLFGDTPMLPLHTAAGFAETMTRAYGLGKKQQLKLENLIIESYANAGIFPEDRSTWSRLPPTIEDVWQLFLNQEKVDEDSLYAALAKLARFKIFESDSSKIGSLYDLISGVTVIELAGYPSEIQNLVVALTLDLFYAQMQKKGKPQVVGDLRQITKMILVDEADNFMSQDFTSLRRILKEGREYGVGVILSTQDITHFKTGENDYSAYILTWVVHRVAQIKNADVKAIFNKDDKADQEQLMETIRKLDKHYSLYVDGEKRLQKMRDTAFWELF